MFDSFKEDIKSFMEHDPAARSPIEIVLLYPGFKALQSHKRAKWFLNHNMPFIARYISQRSAHKTGIEIHPGATIGRRVCIDHGNGIVIGETTEIGDDVMIYQGVTLGGTGKDVGKRHPTIESGVMIGSGAKVLGPITIGRNAKVAAGAVVVKDVEPNCTVVGVPGEVVRIDGERVDDLDQINIPDPLMNLIRENQAEIKKLKEEIEKLKKELCKLTGENIVVSIFEIKNPDMVAQLVANNVAKQIENRGSYRMAQKRAIRNTMKAGAKGIKILASGRLNGVDIARSEVYSEGTVPLHTLRADIDYATAEADTTFGKIGIKVWIYKGEVLPKKNVKGGSRHATNAKKN